MDQSSARAWLRDEAAAQRLAARAVRRAGRGQALNTDEATALVMARGDVLAEACAAARSVRDARLRAEGRPGVVTYSPKVFAPLTRLCRDRCHYCAFAVSPAQLRRSGEGLYMSIAQIVDLARRGGQQGCREVLFTLGDRPEHRWPAAAAWLAEAGYDSTAAYVRAAAIAVLEETGLLPHLNPGVLSAAELRSLRPVAPSMGLMLETSSRRLWQTPGEVHYGSVDKDPAVRLAMIRDAGRQAIPFTTGVLAGIGETPQEMAESLLALRSAALEHGHIQEVIVQNFRAKAGTAAAERPDLESARYLAVVAAARLVLPATVAIQAPPNLSDPEALVALLGAGVDDWGGVSPITPDHVNPERPWPQLADLQRATAEAGFTLRPRLTVHPRFVRSPQGWIDGRLHEHVRALADGDGLASTAVADQCLPAPGLFPRSWQAEESAGYAAFAARSAGGQVDLFRIVDEVDRIEGRRDAADEVYGDWSAVAGSAARASAPAAPAAPAVLRLDDTARGLRLAESDPAALADPRHEGLAVALMSCTGADLARLCQAADEVRQDRVGPVVTFVVNRNINFTNVCYTGCRFCAFAQRASDVNAYTLSLAEVAQRAREAADEGATEICMQGGIHPDLPGTAYFDLIRSVKEAVPEMHVHAFSPMEVINGASRAGMTAAQWLAEAKDAGLGSIPGTAAEILDDDVRWVLTKGKLSAAEWIDVVTAAHEVGLPSTATMMYGHVDRPGHWVGHLRTIRAIQDRTGGFTEFVPLPFIHTNTPLYLAGVARPGPTARDNLAVHAMARLMLDGAVANIQTSWVKLGPEGTAAMLSAGVNDLGGTLMEETISRMAGSQFGSSMTVGQLRAIAASARRPARQRTTLYRQVLDTTGAAAGVASAATAGNGA